MKLSFVAVVTASVVLFFNGVCGADTPTTTSMIDPRESSSAVVEDFVLAGRKLLQAVTKEEANKVWHRLMKESEVPPSLRGSEKIGTEMYENVEADVTDRRQLVLRDSEKIRERRLPASKGSWGVDEFELRDEKGALLGESLRIRRDTASSYAVEFWKAKDVFEKPAAGGAGIAKKVGVEPGIDDSKPGLGDIVGANCYDIEGKKMGKSMRVEYFQKDGEDLKMKNLLLHFINEDECKSAQVNIVNALVNQEGLECVPGRSYIKKYSVGLAVAGSGLHRPLFCSNWCKAAFKPIGLNLDTQFKTAEVAAMFWSTGSGRRQDNMQDAQNFAKERGFKTLEQTLGGEILDHAKLWAREKLPAYNNGGMKFEINSEQVWISSVNHVGYLWNCASMEIAKATGEKLAAKGKEFPVHVYAEKANAVSPFALLNTIPTWYNIELPSMIGAYLDNISGRTNDDSLLKNKLVLTYHWKNGGEVVDARRRDTSAPTFTAKEVLDVFYQKGEAYPGYGEDEAIEEILCNSDKGMAKSGQNCHPFGKNGRLACAPGLKCVNKNRLSTSVEDDYECSSGESRKDNTVYDSCVYDTDCANGHLCMWTEGLEVDGSIKKEKTGGVCQISLDKVTKRSLCYSPQGRCTECDIMKKEFVTILQGCKCSSGKLEWTT